MNLGVDELYNLLHNNKPSAVARHIRANASNVVGSLKLLDSILETKKTFSKELKNGVNFSIVFSRHLTSTKDSKPTGFGDTIAKITKSVGINPCGGCKKRQATLNRIFPYKPESTR